MSKIINYIFPTFYAYYNEIKLNNKIKNISSSEIEKYLKLDYALLKTHNKTLNEMKKSIEDKAKINTISITISITLSFGFIALLNDKLYIYSLGPTLKFFIIFFLIMSLISLIISGFTALRVLKIKKYYDIYLNDELKSEEEKKIEIVKCLLSNQFSNTIIGNYLYVSYQHILRGLFFIFITFALIIFIINIYSPEKKDNKNNVNCIYLNLFKF